MSNEEEKDTITLEDRQRDAEAQLEHFLKQENDLQQQLQATINLKNQALGRIKVLQDLRSYQTENGDGPDSDVQPD